MLVTFAEFDVTTLPHSLFEVTGAAGVAIGLSSPMMTRMYNVLCRAKRTSSESKLLIISKVLVLVNVL